MTPEEYVVWLLANTIPNGECLECHKNRGALYPKLSASIYAHRYVYEVLNGDLPEGMYVCHKCDNSKCINPEHLFAGTPQDNVDDMISKGRMGKVGGGKPRLFNAKDVSKMLELRAQGKSQRQIAVEFNTSQVNIWSYLKEADNDRRSAN